MPKSKNSTSSHTTNPDSDWPATSYKATRLDGASWEREYLAYHDGTNLLDTAGKI